MAHIELYQKGKHDLSKFDCGNTRLNNYLKNNLVQDAKSYLVNAFILVEDDGTVVGYFTLSAYGVDSTQSLTYLKKNPYKQAPAVLLGRLAVDKNHQGQGHAKHMLVNAIERYMKTRENLGVTSLIVDAIDENAYQMWQHFGFKPVEGTTDRLVMTNEYIDALAAELNL